MRLEDIDGDVYASESLLEALAASQPAPAAGGLSPRAVIDGREVGLIRGFTFDGSQLEVTFSASIDPLSLLTDASIYAKLEISDRQLSRTFLIQSVSCDIVSQTCTVTAIHSREVSLG